MEKPLKKNDNIRTVETRKEYLVSFKTSDHYCQSKTYPIDSKPLKLIIRKPKLFFQKHIVEKKKSVFLQP
jgi:hypothetical protein